jgi:hypothetical protein
VKIQSSWPTLYQWKKWKVEDVCRFHGFEQGMQERGFPLGKGR